MDRTCSSALVLLFRTRDMISLRLSLPKTSIAFVLLIQYRMKTISDRRRKKRRDGVTYLTGDLNLRPDKSKIGAMSEERAGKATIAMLPPRLSWPFLVEIQPCQVSCVISC